MSTNDTPASSGDFNPEVEALRQEERLSTPDTPAPQWQPITADNQPVFPCWLWSEAQQKSIYFMKSPYGAFDSFLWWNPYSAAAGLPQPTAPIPTCAPEYASIETHVCDGKQSSLNTDRLAPGERAYAGKTAAASETEGWIGVIQKMGEERRTQPEQPAATETPTVNAVSKLIGSFAARYRSGQIHANDFVKWSEDAMDRLRQLETDLNAARADVERLTRERDEAQRELYNAVNSVAQWRKDSEALVSAKARIEDLADYIRIQKEYYSELRDDRDKLRGSLDFYEQYDHDTAQCAAEAWKDLANFEGEEAAARMVIEHAIRRVAGGLRDRIRNDYLTYAENMKQANEDYIGLAKAFDDKAARSAKLEGLLCAILSHPNIPAESVQCCRDASAYLSATTDQLTASRPTAEMVEACRDRICQAFSLTDEAVNIVGRILTHHFSPEKKA